MTLRMQFGNARSRAHEGVGASSTMAELVSDPRMGIDAADVVEQREYRSTGMTELPDEGDCALMTPNSRSRRTIVKLLTKSIGVGVAAAAAIALSACSGGGGTPGGDATGLQTINIVATHGTDLYGLPWYAAKDQGFFENHGLQVGKLINGASGGTDDVHALTAGGMDIGTIAVPAAVKGAAAGEKIVVVAGATQAVTDVNYYALASSKIQTINDIKRWGYTSPGSTTQSLAYVVADHAKLNTSRIDFVATGGFGEGVALLEAGKIDVAYVPPATYLADPSKWRLIVNSVDYVPSFEQVIMASTTKYVTEHPDNVRAAILAYQDGVEWIEQNPEKAAPILAKNSKVSEEIAQKMIKTAVDSKYWGTAYDKQALTFAAEAMNVVGDSKTEVPWCTLFSTKFLPEGGVGSLPVECK